MSFKNSDTEEKAVPTSRVTAAPDDIFGEDDVDPVFRAKATILNDAMADIGMGRYQWLLFVVSGFGWFVDNSAPIAISLIFTPVLYELKPKHGPYLTVAQAVGLLVGAFVFSLSSDALGRKLAFNTTLGLLAVFTLVAGSSPTFGAAFAFTFLLSIGVGGNLPVDSALFLEFIPASHQYLMTVLSSFWALGQLITCVIAWALITPYSCADPETCSYANNKGWRYFLFAMGGMFSLFFLLRFCFPMRESPKWLMSRGRDAEAVAVVHAVAKFNGKTSSLTVEDLTAAGGAFADAKPIDTTTRGAISRNLAKFDSNNVKRLFATKRLAWSTSLIISLWGVIGLAFPLYQSFLPYYLATRITTGDHSAGRAYRDNIIIAVISIPAAIGGGFATQIPGIGRKGLLSFSAVATGVFLFGSTTAKTQNVLLTWNCFYGIASNVLYGVLYGYTPELFATRDRGTGNGLAACANRIFGIMSPIIAIYGDLTTSVPVFVSGGLFIVAGAIVLLLPYESRGRAAL